MVYSDQFNVGFPNGRRLTDDVAALLARNGDTLLLELSLRSRPGRDHNERQAIFRSVSFSADPCLFNGKAGWALSAKNQTTIRTVLGLLPLLESCAVGYLKLVELLRNLFVKRPVRA